MSGYSIGLSLKEDSPFEEIITYLNNAYHLDIQMPKLRNNKSINEFLVNVEFVCGDNHIMALEYKKYNNNELNSIDENKIEKMAIERFYSLIEYISLKYSNKILIEGSSIALPYYIYDGIINPLYESNGIQFTANDEFSYYFDAETHSLKKCSDEEMNYFIQNYEYPKDKQYFSVERPSLVYWDKHYKNLNSILIDFLGYEKGFKENNILKNEFGKSNIVSSNLKTRI